MQEPKIIKGGKHIDFKGVLNFNNDFDASEVKRIYIVENSSTGIKLQWQGHKIEKRWFLAINGSFLIRAIKIDDWTKPSKNLKKVSFFISAENTDILLISRGYATSIQAINTASKLLVMADYKLNEINDEYKYSAEYFK